MWDNLTQYNDVGLLVLRLALGVIFIYHARPKLTNAPALAGGMGMSEGNVKALGWVELLAGAAVILGIYTQAAALLLAIVMLGAIYYKTQKWRIPFSAMDKTGWEFDLILLGASVALLLGGGGSIGFGW